MWWQKCMDTQTLLPYVIVESLNPKILIYLFHQNVFVAGVFLQSATAVLIRPISDSEWSDLTHSWLYQFIQSWLKLSLDAPHQIRKNNAHTFV